MVLLPQHIRQRPVTQTLDLPKLAFAIEDLLRPLAGKAERAREFAEQLDDLRNMVVVFAVSRARLRIEEVVARDEFEDLGKGA